MAVVLKQFFALDEFFVSHHIPCVLTATLRRLILQRPSPPIASPIPLNPIPPITFLCTFLSPSVLLPLIHARPFLSLPFLKPSSSASLYLAGIFKTVFNIFSHYILPIFFFSFFSSSYVASISVLSFPGLLQQLTPPSSRLKTVFQALTLLPRT